MCMGEVNNIYSIVLHFFMFVLCISNINIPLLISNQCTLLVASTLDKIKVTINTPSCFGSRRNHFPGVSQCLAKAIYMVFLCTSMVK
jgi:hypothetical protein